MTKKKAEIQKYEDVRAVNNTALGYFLISPLEFKKYYDEPIESKGEWYDVGSAFHCLILQPELFDDKFVVFDYEKPNSEQKRIFAEDCLEWPNEEIEALYSKVYSIKGKSDVKIAEEASKLFQEVASYIAYLKLRENGKTILTSKSIDIVQNCVRSLRANPKAEGIVTIPNLFGDDLKAYNELEIYFKYKSVDCKSKIDRLIVDKAKKRITIVDFKTTSKKINKFCESFVEYDYERQFAFYAIAVYEFLDKQIGLPDLPNYEVAIVCPIVSTKEPFESRIFAIPLERIGYCSAKIKEQLEDLDWHFNTKNWNYPKCYYEGEGYEVLDY